MYCTTDSPTSEDCFVSTVQRQPPRPLDKQDNKFNMNESNPEFRRSSQDILCRLNPAFPGGGCLQKGQSRSGRSSREHHCGCKCETFFPATLSLAILELYSSERREMPPEEIHMPTSVASIGSIGRILSCSLRYGKRLISL